MPKIGSIRIAIGTKEVTAAHNISNQANNLFFTLDLLVVYNKCCEPSNNDIMMGLSRSITSEVLLRPNRLLNSISGK